MVMEFFKYIVVLFSLYLSLSLSSSCGWAHASGQLDVAGLPEKSVASAVVGLELSSNELKTLKEMKTRESLLSKQVKELAQVENQDFFRAIENLKKSYFETRVYPLDEMPDGDSREAEESRNKIHADIKKASDKMVKNLAVVLNLLEVEYTLEEGKHGSVSLQFSSSEKNRLGKLVKKTFQYTGSKVFFNPYSAFVPGGLEGYYLSREIYISLESIIRFNDQSELTHLLTKFDVEFHEYIHARHDYLLSYEGVDSIYNVWMEPIESSAVHTHGSYASYLLYSEVPAHLWESVALIKEIKKHLKNYEDGTYDSSTQILEIGPLGRNPYNLGVVLAAASDGEQIAQWLLNIIGTDPGNDFNVQWHPNESIEVDRSDYTLPTGTTFDVHVTSYWYFEQEMLEIRILSEQSDLSIPTPDSKLLALAKVDPNSTEFKKLLHKKVVHYLTEMQKASTDSKRFAEKLLGQFSQLEQSMEIRFDEPKKSKESTIKLLQEMLGDSEKLRDKFDFDGRL